MYAILYMVQHLDSENTHI